MLLPIGAFAARHRYRRRAFRGRCETVLARTPVFAAGLPCSQPALHSHMALRNLEFEFLEMHLLVELAFSL